MYVAGSTVSWLKATKETDAATHNGALKQFNYYFIHQGDGSFDRNDYSLISKAEQVRSASESVEPEMFIQKQMKPIRRNPLITTTLYYSKDMESFATGLKRVNEKCAKAGVKFEFHRDPYGFTVRFYRHCGEAWDLTDQHRDYHPGGDKGGETSGDQGVDWTARKEKVLAEIRKEPTISTTRMADHLHLSRRQVEKTLDQLKNEGRLRREGSARSGHWVINE